MGLNIKNFEFKKCQEPNKKWQIILVNLRDH